MARVDLNSDVGEGYGAWPGGPDEELLEIVTSTIIRRTCELAVERGVAIGAQVSYPDLAGFGRRFIDMPAEALTDAVLYQLAALSGMAAVAGGRVTYVKPHGALYNAIVQHRQQAVAVVEAVSRFDSGLAVLGLPGAVVGECATARGLRFVEEGFADRAYTAEGTLVPRGQAGALVTDPGSAAVAAVDLGGRGVTSICVHSDTPGAVRIAAAVRTALETAGFEVGAFG
jgi:UPF0271 protein